MPGPAGKRTETIAFLAQASVKDDWNEDVGAWAEVARAKAEIVWGSGSERRQAAETGGQQAATFAVLATAATRAIGDTHRIAYPPGGAQWDIHSVVKRDRAELEFYAVKAAS